MVVYVCTDSELQIPLKELDTIHKSYLHGVLEKPIGKFKYMAFPMYTAKKNIPEKYRKSNTVKAIKIYDRDVYDAIKERERIENLSENIFRDFFSLSTFRR